jgi:hypothetical protein
VNDRNPVIEARARVRGGGSRVPLKVVNRPVTFNPTLQAAPVYYRIISAGFAATNQSSPYIVTASGTATGMYPGFYGYDPLNNTQGTALVSTKNSFLRSWNVLTIDRTTGGTTTRTFDVFNVSSAEADFRNYLNGLTSSVIVVIATMDEPETSVGNPLTYGLTTAYTVGAVQRCGASSNFGSANNVSHPGFINYRGSYVLIGIPGIGMGNGIERYQGINNGNTGDPNAFLDVRMYVLAGQYKYLSG